MHQWQRALQETVAGYDMKQIRDLIDGQPKKMQRLIDRNGRRVD